MPLTPSPHLKELKLKCLILENFVSLTPPLSQRTEAPLSDPGELRAPNTVPYHRELKLKCLILENFVPAEERAKLLQRAVLDEDDDRWRLAARATGPQLNRRPVSALGSRRPVSEYARLAGSVHGGTRYKVCGGGGGEAGRWCGWEDCTRDARGEGIQRVRNQVAAVV